MKRLSGFLKKAFDKQINGTGLAVFRIAYSIVLLCEIAQMFYFRKLIFDAIPDIEKSEISFAVPIILWFISVVFILFGFFTRFFTILNYLLGLILIGTASNFEYHVYYAYMGINFLIIFLPISKCFSIDRLLLKLKYSNHSFLYNPSKNCSQLYYYILPLVAIGFVYFDSVFFKFSSSMWTSGLGSWLPCSLPMITHFNNSFLLNQEYIIKSIGWFTLFFETIFIIVFFRKKWRFFVFIIGMILHLGILLQFPIPWFGLTVCAVYLLLIPISFWKNLSLKFKGKTTLNVYFSNNSIFERKAIIIIKHFDFFDKIQIHLIDNIEIKAVNEKDKEFYQIDVFIQMLKKTIFFPFAVIFSIPGIYWFIKKRYIKFKIYNTTFLNSNEYKSIVPLDDKNRILLEGFSLYDLKYKVIVSLVVFLAFFQSTMLYGTWLMNDIKLAVGFKGTNIDNTINEVIKSYSKFFKFTLGITGHPVFSNEIHFNGYNHIVAVVYLDKNNNEIWLPIINKNGQPDFYIYGANWVNWTFRVNEQNINLEKMSNGIKRYTAFWAYKNEINLKNAKFILKVKKIIIPTKWEKDFLNKQIANPWLEGGFVEWKETKFTSNIKNIESI